MMCFRMEDREARRQRGRHREREREVGRLNIRQAGRQLHRLGRNVIRQTSR